MLCAGLDLLGVAAGAALLDGFGGTNLLEHPQWVIPFGFAYVLFSWLFGSYTLLRLPRLRGVQVLVRLGMAALATSLMVVLAYWVLRLPPSFTLGYRRTQLLLLAWLSLWALVVRLALRRLVRLRQPSFPSLLEKLESLQQRLLPALLPEEALTLEGLPWADPLSVQRQLKRGADVAVALLLLLAALPLMALAGLLIWLEDRGPVFFVQERSGLMGRSFQLYKLRTMCQAAADAPATWTVRGDARITRTGAILRRVRLDELPQLLNVLRGHMSIVGPRPHALVHDYEYGAMIANYAYRHHVKPGITGWAQVNGARGETPTIAHMQARVDLDAWYVENQSLTLDLLVLAKTPLEVLRTRNAH